MKKAILIGSFFFLCYCSVWANSDLDSLYREYHKAKIDTERIYFAIQIVRLRTVPGSEYYNPDSAIALLETNLALAKSKNHPEFLAYLLYTKSNYLLLKREYESAGLCIDSAIRLIEPLKLYLQLGSFYFTKARIYEELKLPQRCVEFIYKAIASYEKSGEKGATSNTLFYLTRLYKDNHQYGKAEELYLKSAKLSNDSVDAAMCYAFCASMALKRNDLNQAKEYLDKS